MSESSQNSSPFYDLAVVIGINRYQNGIPELKTARFDAERLAGILKEKPYYYEVKLFTDEQEQATSSNIWTYLKAELPEKIKHGKNKRVRLLFYFAGHGAAPQGENGEAGYLFPQDAQSDKTDKLLSMKEIHDVLAQLGCQHLLIILDCCYAGAFRFGSRDLSSMPEEELSKERYGRYLEDVGQVIASATYDQKALDLIETMTNLNDNRGTDDNSNNSPFAALLFKALEDPVADYMKDGITTATELGLYLGDKLRTLTEKQNQPQICRTWYLPKLDKGEFFFKTGAFDHEKLPGAIELNKDNNPYRGLKSFEEGHSGLFFGRSKEIDDLKQRINSPDQLLTVVLGNSGSGKSSLVKAGLIPKLRENPAQWCILEPMRPGATPSMALARAVLPLELKESNPDLTTLKKLDDLLRQARRKNPNDVELKKLFAEWRRATPEDKLLLIIMNIVCFKKHCGDQLEGSTLENLREIGLRRSSLVLNNFDISKGSDSTCQKLLLNSEEQNQRNLLYDAYSKRIQYWSEKWQKDGNKFGEFIVEQYPKDGQTKLLLVIDQFEELITQCNQDDRKQFLIALQVALQSCPQQLRLVLTLRSDFQYRFEVPEQLQNYWKREEAGFRINPMKRDQLREVIEQPALAQILYFETNKQKNDKSFIDQLLDDVGETPGILPLLSFTLSELYSKYVENVRDTRTLIWEDYEKLGGVIDSITHRATEEYDRLAIDFVDRVGGEVNSSETQHQRMLRWVMLRMITLEGGEKAKRQVLESELDYGDPERNELCGIVIDRFVDARLLVTGTNPDGATYIEPVHDVLVSNWDKITNWLSEIPQQDNVIRNQDDPKPQKKSWLERIFLALARNNKREKRQTRFDLNLQRDLTIAANKWDGIK